MTDSRQLSDGSEALAGGQKADLTYLFFFINLTVTHRAFQSLTSGFLGSIISNLLRGNQQWSYL
jgi:hypothetical protein